jgi:hypothetical protein
MPSQAVGSLQPMAAGEKTRDILGDAGFREHTGRMAWDSLVCQLTGEFEPVPAQNSQKRLDAREGPAFSLAFENTKGRLNSRAEHLWLAAVGDARSDRVMPHFSDVQEVWCRRSLRVGGAGVISPIKSPNSLNAYG